MVWFGACLAAHFAVDCLVKFGDVALPPGIVGFLAILST